MAEESLGRIGNSISCQARSCASFLRNGFPLDLQREPFELVERRLMSKCRELFLGRAHEARLRARRAPLPRLRQPPPRHRAHHSTQRHPAHPRSCRNLFRSAHPRPSSSASRTGALCMSQLRPPKLRSETASRRLCCVHAVAECHPAPRQQRVSPSLSLPQAKPAARLTLQFAPPSTSPRVFTRHPHPTECPLESPSMRRPSGVKVSLGHSFCGHHSP